MNIHAALLPGSIVVIKPSFLLIAKNTMGVMADLNKPGETSVNIKAGLLSGFAATLVLSLLMMAKSTMGIMPDLNAITMMSGMMNAPPVMGWVAHFLIGSVIWGVLFAVLVDKLPGSVMSSAIVFSIGIWLLMMVGPMPMAGAGYFGLHIGVMAPVATLMLHIVWGIVLGLTYARLSRARPDKF